MFLVGRAMSPSGGFAKFAWSLAGTLDVMSLCSGFLQCYIELGLFDAKPRVTWCILSSECATHILVPLQSSPSLAIYNLAKRRKLDGSETKHCTCAFPSWKLLLKCWDIVTFINKDLVKKPVAEVEVNGSKTLLNFLHMLQLGMDSGSHQPIAWIDVSGKCFFPEIVTDDELYGCRYYGAESQGCNDINVKGKMILVIGHKHDSLDSDAVNR
ncbi:putative inactive poly [ADP-ribose] polymerase SRO1 [Sesamum angolense]|uniref:Inactive poly [ADP-ribose] polymerase SRO1 n=1 Tax=Sesamum angolense TaxID=2727404 RepID=A0AAE2BK62_9LAMI|nr:putative inactive poly [ADP-ribose] polymerase SRO1 [Sesamum angolense]